MKLGTLKQGDKFRYALFPNGGTYLKGSEIPGSMGDKFYVHSGDTIYTEGGDADIEVIKVK